jgi:transposase
MGPRLRESIGIDSLLGVGRMPKAYSADMRERVIARVESGASRREAAEYYDVSASAAVIWVKCFRETGRCAAKPRGGSMSSLEAYADFLLVLIEEQPDLTLDEVVSAMRKHKIPGSRTAVWRFFQRHRITFKKKPARGGAAARGRGAGAAALDARTRHV